MSIDFHLLKTILFTPGIRGRWGLPHLFWGPPGIGKSGEIESYATRLGLHCEVVIASLREPADFLGLPIPRELDGRTVVDYAPPGWALRAAAAGNALVFFDEITTCAPSVQSALLRPILDGVVGDFQLPPTVRFLAAANPVEQAAGGHDLTMPLSNRFGHSDVSPDSIGWAQWLLSGSGADQLPEGRFADDLQDRVLTRWPTAFAKAKGIVAAFIQRNSTVLFSMPKAHDPSASKAWASPRTWEMATRAIAGAAVHELDEVTAHNLLASYVGDGPAGEFLSFQQEHDLPNPADVLDGRVQWAHDVARLDRTVAVLGACQALVLSDEGPRQDQRLEALWGVLGSLADTAADVALPVARELTNRGMIKSPRAIAALQRYRDVVVASGVVSTGR